MKLSRIFTALAVATFLVAAAGVANAQIEKEKSIFTLNEPTEIGSQTVPAGTYMIKVVPLSYNRNVVQVTSEDGTKVFASALATPHPKKVDEQVSSSRFVYYPAVEGQPRALRTWFAPDTPYGQDIVYPKKRAAELAAAAKENVISIPEETKEADYKTVPYTTVAPEKTDVAQAPAPEPPTTVAETNTTTTQSTTSDTSLPRTASRVPAAALLGTLALAAALALHRRTA